MYLHLFPTVYCCYTNSGGAEQSYDELNFFFALLFCKPAWCVMKKLWALRICGPSTSLTFLGKSSKLGHYRKVEKNRLNPRCISCYFFCSRTSQLSAGNFFFAQFLANKSASLTLLSEWFLPDFFLKDEGCEICSYSTLQFFKLRGSYIKTGKKRRIGKEAPAFLWVRKAHISYLTNVNVRYI